MNFDDLQKYVGPLASVTGLLGTIFGIFFWWHKRTIRKMDADHDKTRRELLEARKHRRNAEDRVEIALAEKAEVLDDKAEFLKKARFLRRWFDHTRKELADVTRHRDNLIKELTTLGANYQSAFQELKAGTDRMVQAMQEDQVRFQHELAQLSAERDELAQKLSEKKSEIRESRKDLREILRREGRIWSRPVGADAPVFRARDTRKAIIIAVLNLKGGVGKTTISANLAGLLGEQGKKVLLLDLDHQRSLSQMLLTDTERTHLLQQKRSIQSYLDGKLKTGSQLLANTTPVVGMANCALIANHDPEVSCDVEIGLEELEMQLMLSWLMERDKTADIRFYLRRGLQDDVVANSYDYVFLDCPPRLSTACINALAAADYLLIPVPAEAVASQSVAHLLARVKVIREAGVCDSLRVLGIVGNFLKPTRELETSPEVARIREIAATIPDTTWPEPITSFQTVLPRMSQYFDASRELEQGGKLRLAVDFPSVRLLYENLAREIQERVHDC